MARGMQYGAPHVDCDFAIVGSGFGGSVSALRLAEKGYTVTVLEQGRRILPADMEAARHDLRRLMWAPRLGWQGFFSQHIFRHVGIVGGVGVGGGSLVYAATLLAPPPDHFRDPAWSELGVDWAAELQPHYATARQMLGAVTSPRMGPMDEYLRLTARSMGAEDSFGPVPLGIYFGDPTRPDADPFFAGRGPARTGCRFCGGCLTGCPYGSKNSLDQNYLYLAERLGARVLPGRKVTGIRPAAGGGYELSTIDPLDRRRPQPALRARRVILAAGVLGTVELLLRCRDQLRTLPALSPQLGVRVRTNSEAIVGILARDPDVDLTEGTAISSHFHPDAVTHITQNRFSPGYAFFRWYMGPLVDGAEPWPRSRRTLRRFLRHPLDSTRSQRARDWHKRVSVLTVMQHVDNQVTFRLRRGLLGGTALASMTADGARLPSYLPQANRAARLFARHAGGDPLNVLPESLAGLSVTAHILGGCAIGRSPERGVIDPSHQVFGYPGLYVADASAIPANIGVNPSLTITALAERCMSLIPGKPG